MAASRRLVIAALLSLSAACAPGTDLAPATGPTVTVTPTEIDDVLSNPGIGFADFHFRAGALAPGQHPPTTVAYFRWSWAELEPAEGRFAFDLVDGVIAEARRKGKTLAFRIMSHWLSSTPQWLLDMGVGGVAVPDGTFPDHTHPLFVQYHRRLLHAFGARYAGSPDLDHVDIGSVGCWGEWNTACCPDPVKATCEQYFPAQGLQRQIVDWYVEAFPGTPLVALVGGQVEYAASRGAGWRGDCFGDYGMFSPTWNHMEHVYEPAAGHAVVGHAWRRAPVQLEACGTMQDWKDHGFDIDRILQKGLAWHVSVFNAKAFPVPAEWRGQVDAFLTRLGYRLVLRELTHTASARPGESLQLRSRWENKGVAPVYHAWPLAYRLRAATGEVAATWWSDADLRAWLPGRHDVEDTVPLPPALPPGAYALDVGILTEDGTRAHVRVAIAGGGDDLWHPISQVAIVP